MIPVNLYAMFCDVKAVLSSSVTLDFKTIVNLITVQFNYFYKNTWYGS